jgi:hypothetical protein
MIDRREMVKLVVVGVVGTVVAGSSVAGQAERVVAAEPMRFSIEGDMGAVRATANGESIRVSGDFAERAVFAIG